MKEEPEEVTGTQINELMQAFSQLEKMKAVPPHIYRLIDRLRKALTETTDTIDTTVITLLEEKYANENTRKCYYFAFEKFHRWCTENNISLSYAGYQDVAPYFEQIKQTLRMKSIRTHIAAIRAICDELMIRGVIEANPIAQLNKPETPEEKIPKTEVLTLEEVQKLFRVFDGKKLKDTRDRAIVGLLLYAWVPVTSIPDIRLQDLKDCEEGKFICAGIRGTTYEIPLHPDASTYVQEYLNAAKLSDPQSLLFQSLGRDKKLTNKKLDRHYIQHFLYYAGEKIGIDDLNPSRLRMTGITALMQSGQSVNKKAGLVGTRNLNTISQYQTKAENSEPNLYELFESTNIRQSLQEFVKKSGIFSVEDGYDEK